MLSSIILKTTLLSSARRNKITEAAESVGLPTFVVADAGRTEVSIRILVFYSLVSD